MEHNYDEILKRALAPKDEPDFWLNQKILNKVREENKMNGRKHKRISAAVLTAVLVLGAGSVTALAAWKYLMPEQVAEQAGDEKLADAFMNGDAVFVNETQSYGGYEVTFLGIISGRQLSEGLYECNVRIREDRSHIVVAIKNADGTPMPDTSEDAYGELNFFVSPFIKGCRPADYNAVTLAGNYTDIVEEGVLYRLLECDNVEIFADCGLYLGVMDSTFFNGKAYHYDEITGEISRNDSYQGLNALFPLPIDRSKADPEAAAAMVEALSDEMESTDVSHEPDTEDIIPEGYCTDESLAVHIWLERLSADNIEELAMRVESSVQILSVDQEGYLNVGSYEIEGRGGSDGMKILVPWAFKDIEIGVINILGNTGSGTFDTVKIETFTKNEDGTYTFAVYIPKEQ